MALKKYRIALRALTAVFVLSAPLWAPRIPPQILSWLGPVWLVALIELIWWLLTRLSRRFGRVVAGLTVGLGVLWAAVVGIPWDQPFGTRLPCRRNWEWLPSYLPRSSPTRSTEFQVGQATVKVCYGSPHRRGRRMVGSSRVPYGHLWRTGANEPTTIRSTAPLRFADLTIPAGAVSLYTIPGPETWEIILNRSVKQWGIEGLYPTIEKHEIGRTVLRSKKTDTVVEAFQIAANPTGSRDTVHLTIRWEEWSVVIPVISALTPHPAEGANSKGRD